VTHAGYTYLLDEGHGSRALSIYVHRSLLRAGSISPTSVSLYAQVAINERVADDVLGIAYLFTTLRSAMYMAAVPSHAGYTCLIDEGHGKHLRSVFAAEGWTDS
jgi:hypothetical protein